MPVLFLRFPMQSTSQEIGTVILADEPKRRRRFTPKPSHREAHPGFRTPTSRWAP